MNIFTMSGVVTGIVTSNAISASEIPGSVDYEVADGTQVKVGWIVTVTNGVPTFTAPPAVPPTIDVPTFMNLFTLQEQLAIEGSTDPMVVTMWKRFSDPRVQSVNLALGSIQGALTYLSTTMQQPAVTPPSTYIQPDRIAQISAGTPQ